MGRSDASWLQHPDTRLEEARLENTALLCRGLQVFDSVLP